MDDFDFFGGIDADGPDVEDFVSDWDCYPSQWEG